MKDNSVPNITRIKNNQITDSTITAAKIATNTLTGGLFATNLTLNSNVTILGNLTVANSFAQLNSINTYINDPVVVFNNNYTGSPTYDIGMLINRNLNSLAPYGAVNAAFVWKEADTAFEGIMTTETGTTAGAINNSGFANLKVGNVTANSLTITTGSITASNGITGTPISGSTGYFTTAQATNFSTANTVITGGYVSGLANVQATQATFTNFGTANAVITGGYVNGLANVTATYATITNFGTGNAQITGGTITGLTNLASTTSVATNFSSGNAVITGGYANGLANVTAATSYIVNQNATNGNVTTLVATNFSTANAVITGGYVNGVANVSATQATVTNFFSGNITGNFTQGSLNGTVPTANVSLYDSFTATTTNATFYPQLVDKTTGNGSGFTASTLTHNPSTGVLSATQFSGAGNFTTAVVTNLSSGNVVLTGGYVNGLANVSATQATITNFATGNARISGGYADAFPIGANTAATGAFTTLTASGVTTLTSATTATSTSSGALQVTGGTGIGGNLYVGGISVLNGNVTIGGNLIVSGQSVSIGASTLSIVDPIISLNTPADLSPLTVATTSDIGIKFHYYDIADSHAFLGRAVDTGYLEWYAKGNDTANVFTGTYYGTTKMGGAVFANAKTVGGGLTANTGSFQVYGDGSVSGNLYIGATATTATINATTSVITATLNAGTIGNAGAAFSGASSTLTGTAIATTVNAGTIGNIGANHVGTGTYLTSLNGSNVNGTVGTANVSLYDSMTAYTTNQTFYLQFANVTNGNTTSGATTNINVNPSTGNVSATAFVGSGAYLTNISIGALSGTYPTANVALYENLTNSTTNATFYVPFYDKATGNAAAYTNTSVSVNPSTGTLSATTFSGAISSSMVTTALGFTPYNATNPAGYQTSSGSVNSATYATQASSVNINTSTSSTAYYPVLTDSTAGGAQNEYVDGNGILKYTPSTGNLTTANLVTTWGANINVGQNTGNGADLYVLGKNTTSLIWARPNATYDQVLIGNSATASTLVRGAKLQINSTDSMMIPAGTTAQRPSSTGGTDTTGMLRFNTTSTAMEIYTGSSWQSLTTQFTVIADQQFNGDGATTAFTLTESQTTNACIVSINGVIQIPTAAYSVSGVTLTFTEAPASGDLIDVRKLTTTATVTAISGANGYMGFYADNNGAYVTTGTAAATNTTYWDTSGGQVSAIGNVTVASANTATTVDTMSTSTYRSAKYIVQVTNGTNYQVMEALMISNGTTATITTYGTIQTNGNLGVLAATQTGSNVTLQFIATNASNVVRIKKDYLVI